MTAPQFDFDPHEDRVPAGRFEGSLHPYAHYRERGMAAYAALQQRELGAEEQQF